VIPNIRTYFYILDEDHNFYQTIDREREREREREKKKKKKEIKEKEKKKKKKKIYKTKKT